MSLFELQIAIHKIYCTLESIAHKYAIVDALRYNFSFIKFERIHVSFSS